MRLRVGVGRGGEWENRRRGEWATDLHGWTRIIMGQAPMPRWERGLFF